MKPNLVTKIKLLGLLHLPGIENYLGSCLLSLHRIFIHFIVSFLLDHLMLKYGRCRENVNTEGRGIYSI